MSTAPLHPPHPPDTAHRTTAHLLALWERLCLSLFVCVSVCFGAGRWVSKERESERFCGGQTGVFPLLLCGSSSSKTFFRTKIYFNLDLEIG